jgi:serine/threonine protein kinase
MPHVWLLNSIQGYTLESINFDYILLLKRISQSCQPLFLLKLFSCISETEQNCAKKPTHHMDIYSFGVILLELITGKPAEQPAADDSIDIVRWVRRRVNVTDGASQILDPSISHAAQQGMQAALELALRCTSVMPDQRPAMDEVVRSLQSLCFSVHPQTLPSTEDALQP